jgi:hypothetical protein
VASGYREAKYYSSGSVVEIRTFPAFFTVALSGDMALPSGNPNHARNQSLAEWGEAPPGATIDTSCDIPMPLLTGRRSELIC